MKILCLSDLHGYLPPLDTLIPSDVVLIAGDICPVSNHGVGFQKNWLKFMFAPWVKSLHTKTLVIAGNHDWFFESSVSIGFKPDGWTYLEDSGCEYMGLKFWGTPWQLPFCDWAFNLAEPMLSKKWDMIPKNTNVVLCHSPPLGYGDLAPRGPSATEHCGSVSLRDKLYSLPDLHLAVYGHIHEGYGVHKDGKFVNASIMDGRYRPVNKPIYVELPV